MKSIIFEIGIGTFSFLLFLLIHFCLWQLKKGLRGVYFLVIIAIFCFMITHYLFLFYFNLEIEMNVWNYGPLHFSLTMIYLHLYVGIDRSVSIRILGEIYKHNKKILKFSDLSSFYRPSRMISKRVDLLVKKGFLLEENGKYCCLSSARYLSIMNIWLRKIYLLKYTGW